MEKVEEVVKEEIEEGEEELKKPPPQKQGIRIMDPSP